MTLLRYFGTFLQCSCGTLGSIEKDEILDPRVCSVINSLRNDLYSITCKDNPTTSSPTVTNSPTTDHTPPVYLGCVMKDLFQYQELVEVNITEIGGVAGISAELCQGFCSSMPTQIRFREVFNK